MKTLAHELGHIRADHEHRFLAEYQSSPQCRGIAEVEAESIAYLICAAAGLDAAEYSVGYVAGWSNGDVTLLRDTATRVITTSAAVIAASPAPDGLGFQTQPRWPSQKRTQERGLRDPGLLHRSLDESTEFADRRA